VRVGRRLFDREQETDRFPDHDDREPKLADGRIHDRKRGIDHRKCGFLFAASTRLAEMAKGSSSRIGTGRKNMKLDIFQVDAFTSKPFGGNPAAVVPLAEWLSDDTMLNIAAENNLSETAFFVKNNGRYDLRWFTPTVEVDLCGHATLATSHVIFKELKLENEFIKFHSDRSGELGVLKQGDKLVMDFPAYSATKVEPNAAIALAVGMVPLETWETQRNMVMLLFRNEADIRSIAPDMNALSKLPYDEVIVTAKGDGDTDFISRMFAPKLGIPEDPVTGAIHCSLIPYWAKELGKENMFARQVSRRGGELFCELAGDRVRIGGNAVLYLKGEISVEDAALKTAKA
jgi:PhzF family phenazine biosynthesis protein